jgi:transcription initiation factor TFIIIB Brf1 subunit/transcription initiation factor TFIIB
MASEPTIVQSVVSVNEWEVPVDNLTGQETWLDTAPPSWDDETALVVNNDNTSRRSSSNTGKTIEPELKLLDLTEDVKAEAARVFHAMGAPTKKDQGRKKMIMACILIAMAQLDRVHSPKKIAALLNVDPKKISKIMGEYAVSRTNYHWPQRIYTPRQHMTYILDQSQLPAYYRDEAYCLLSRCELKDQTFHNIEEQQPDLYAVAVIIKAITDLAEPGSQDTSYYRQVLLDYVIYDEKKFQMLLSEVSQTIDS